METHPYNPPMVFVRPTSTMQIKQGKHVDSNGKIYLPYLHEWKHVSSDVIMLVFWIILSTKIEGSGDIMVVCQNVCHLLYKSCIPVSANMRTIYTGTKAHLWPWLLTHDHEKLTNSRHYYNQNLCQIWEQSITCLSRNHFDTIWHWKCQNLAFSLSNLKCCFWGGCVLYHWLRPCSAMD